MDKNRSRMKKKPNWKFYTLILTIVALATGLVFTFCLYGLQVWLISILFPVVLSAAASIGVSLWFTVKTERDNLYRELLGELDELFQHTFLLMNNIDSILCSNSFPLLSKKRMIINAIMQNPRLFYISRYYTEYKEFYDQTYKDLLGCTEKIEPKDGQMFVPSDDPVYLEYIMYVHKMTDRNLKLQEQILQDFKMTPKGNIPEQLIFKVKSTQEQKPN